MYSFRIPGWKQKFMTGRYSQLQNKKKRVKLRGNRKKKKKNFITFVHLRTNHHVKLYFLPSRIKMLISALAWISIFMRDGNKYNFIWWFVRRWTNVMKFFCHNFVGYDFWRTLFFVSHYFLSVTILKNPYKTKTNEARMLGVRNFLC